MTTPSHTSPDILKRMEKDLIKSGKTENSNVKLAMSDLRSTEKSLSKATKATSKAEHTLTKSQSKELKTAQAANKATLAHDNAVSTLHQADRDLKLKRQHASQLEQELAEKRGRVDAAIKNQDVHNKEREEKLASIKAQREAPASPKV